MAITEVRQSKHQEDNCHGVEVKAPRAAHGDSSHTLVEFLAKPCGHSGKKPDRVQQDGKSAADNKRLIEHKHLPHLDVTDEAQVPTGRSDHGKSLPKVIADQGRNESRFSRGKDMPNHSTVADEDQNQDKLLSRFAMQKQPERDQEVHQNKYITPLNSEHKSGH